MKAIKPFILKHVKHFVELIDRMMLQEGLKAEMHSALAFLLVGALLLTNDIYPSAYIRELNSLFPQSIIAIILLCFSILQTAGVTYKSFKLRLIMSFVACLTWTTLALLGVLTSLTALIVPIGISFAIIQAIVFLNIDKLRRK